MAAGRKISGLALGSIFTGSVFLYAGIKGKSIPASFQLIIQGKDPRTAGKADQIAGTPAAAAPPPGSVPGGEPGVRPPAGKSETDWIKSFLASIGAPASAANISSVGAWISHESSWDSSPPDGALFTNNPLNTTEPGFGATGDVNSVGVKIYPTPAAGLAATQAVITNGRYGDILLWLRSGKGLCGQSLSGLSIWSGGGYSSVC